MKRYNRAKHFLQFAWMVTLSLSYQAGGWRGVMWNIVIVGGVMLLLIFGAYLIDGHKIEKRFE